ncbi:MAG: LacI family DNA-binding transcriptional regulator [Clostridiales bacterium]|nr:LacI family DNA-binding transcriptional regulator [Clostridiales bacterium]
MHQLTMKDIAKICNVSIKTVSRVINNSNEVKQETREIVLKAIQEHGYQANLMARGLKNKKTNTIIVFIDNHKEKYWGIWHTKMLSCLFKEAKRKKLKIVVSPSSAHGHLDDETDGFHLLTSKMADGAIILDNAENDIRLDFFGKRKIPYVLIGQTNDKSATWVDLDNYNAGKVGCEYLINKGYKKIAFMVGQDQFHVNQLRANGFEDMANERKIDYNISFNIDSVEGVYKNTLEMFKDMKYDAIFISGSERALGAYRAIFELNYKIPEDVAVLGIDNIEQCKYMYPSLSVLDQQCEVFAKKIINMLYNSINKIEDSPQKQLFIENRIIEREST